MSHQTPSEVVATEKERLEASGAAGFVRDAAAERVILTDMLASVEYADEVLDGRWVEFEQMLSTMGSGDREYLVDQNALYSYFARVLCKPVYFISGMITDPAVEASYVALSDNNFEDRPRRSFSAYQLPPEDVHRLDDIINEPELFGYATPPESFDENAPDLPMHIQSRLFSNIWSGPIVDWDDEKGWESFIGTAFNESHPDHTGEAIRRLLDEISAWSRTDSNRVIFLEDFEGRLYASAGMSTLKTVEEIDEFVLRLKSTVGRDLLGPTVDASTFDTTVLLNAWARLARHYDVIERSDPSNVNAFTKLRTLITRERNSVPAPTADEIDTALVASAALMLRHCASTDPDNARLPSILAVIEHVSPGATDVDISDEMRRDGFIERFRTSAAMEAAPAL